MSIETNDSLPPASQEKIDFTLSYINESKAYIAALEDKIKEGVLTEPQLSVIMESLETLPHIMVRLGY